MPLDHGTDFPGIASLANGFHPLSSTPTSGALDYVRSAQLRDGWVVQRVRWWLGAPLPLSRVGAMGTHASGRADRQRAAMAPPVPTALAVVPLGRQRR